MSQASGSSTCSVHGTDPDEDPNRYARIGDIDHTSCMERSNPSYYGYRRRVTNAGSTTTQLQIATRRSGALHRMLNLPDVTGNIQDHHDLDNALAQGGTHPYLHKLARREDIQRRS